VRVRRLSSLDGTLLAYSGESADPDTARRAQHTASLGASIWDEYERAGRATMGSAGSLQQLIATTEAGTLVLGPVAPSGSGDREVTGEGFLLSAVAARDAPLGRVRTVLERVRTMLGPGLSGLGALKPEDAARRLTDTSASAAGTDASRRI
jgi:hypothetical protein